MPFDRLEALIRVQLAQLESAGMKPTHGDIRCITYGHITRLAVLTLYPEWDDQALMPEKLSLLGRVLDGLGDYTSLIARLLAVPGGSAGKLKKPKQPVIAPHAAAV
jgi:hypothetical protein